LIKKRYYPEKLIENSINNWKDNKNAQKLNQITKGLSEEECSKTIKGILLGLKHIHSLDYVHRDLKPSNVVIDDINNLETAKLVDFGLAIKFQSR